MTIPNIPTDNIYKFIALTGIFIFLFSIVYPEYKKQEIENDEIIIANDQRKFEFQKAKIGDNLSEIGKEITKLHDECKCGPKPIISDTNIVWFSLTKGPIELLTLSRRIDTLINHWHLLKEEYALKQVDLISKLELQIQKQKQLNTYQELQYYLLRGSIILAILGFFLWYQKTQRLQDRLLRFQHDEFIKNQYCQSCGIRLKNIKWYNELSDEEQKKVHYCKDCYDNGEYIEPELTYQQMKAKLKNRCKQLGFNRLETHLYLTRLQDLSRWVKKFKW